MAFTYSFCKKLFEQRKKGSDHKVVLSDCKLFDRGDYFEIVFKKFASWEKDANNKWHRVNNEMPLAHVNKGSIVTLLYEGEFDITACNRVGTIIGRNVNLNKRHFANCKQHVRIYPYDSWANSMPYKPGLMFKTNEYATPCLNPSVDIKVVVDNTVVQQAKKEFDTIRKLVKTMARIGAFNDDFPKLNKWEVDLTKVKPLDEVNFNDPVADDAIAVVAHGTQRVDNPSTHRWQSGQYVARHVDDVKREWLARSAEKGLELLRRNYYEQTNGYVEKLAA